MNKRPYIELLAPAGGPEQFRAALAAGADAIYCGVGNDFNARRGADNFDYDTFEACVREAHLAGTRVYVTLNVVVRDDELSRALALVRSCAVRGADAFIIQDWGLFALIHKIWPELELHVSTQANIHDESGVRWAAAQGAKRVTLSRELSLEELRSISAVAAELGVDLEVFGHGALCFCYSGLCLLSSMMGGRSANRGLCAQPCRLLYELVDERGERLNAPERTRPLCPKDNCVAADVAAMMAAGVGSLKVEGRMKAPDYVYNVVSAYRKQIDAVYAAVETGRLAEDDGLAELSTLGSTPLAPEVARQLKRAFNRDFTDAYLRGTSGDELMSYERSNNRGELVGEVTAIKGGQQQRRDGRGNLHKDPRQNKKYARCSAEIRLTEPVGAGDLLELRAPNNYDDFLTASVTADAAAGESITCKISRPVPVGAQVRIIRSKVAHVVTAAALAQSIARKRKVAVRIVARVGEPFEVELTCVDGHVDLLAEHGGSWPGAKATGFVVEPARTKAVTEADLIEHVGRMGTSPFEPVSFDIELDEGVGMGFSAVHKVRAAACDALEQAILAPWAARAKGLAPAPKLDIASEATATAPSSQPQTAPQICVFVHALEVASAALAAGADRVYATEDALAAADAAGKTWPCEVTPIRDEVQRPADTWHAPVSAGSLVSTIPDVAALQAQGQAFEANSTIPVHNVHTLALLEAAGAQTIWLSPELSLKEILALDARATAQLGLVVYGRTRVMTSEHCVLQAVSRCIHDCARCKLRAQAESKGIYLKNKDGKLLPVRTSIHGRSHIYTAEVLDLIPELAKLTQAKHLTRLAIDATLLTPEQAVHEVKRLKAAFQGAVPQAQRVSGTTSGHLFEPIG